MDTKDITSIHVGNTEIQKIVVGGGVVWQELKTWKKYEVRKLKVFTKDTESWDSEYYAIQHNGHIVKDVSYNSDDKKDYTIRYESLKFTRSFYYPATRKMILANRIVILKDYGIRSTCVRVFNREDLRGEELDNNYMAWVERYKYTYRDTEARGKYLCDVEAEENTYPKNGIKDGFWYVLQE